jgi:hypothetical protein
MLFPWDVLERDAARAIPAVLAPPEEDPFDEPEPLPPEEPVEDVEPVDDPVLVDAQLVEEPSDTATDAFASADDLPHELDSDPSSIDSPLGLGPGRIGKYTGRFGDPAGGPGPGGRTGDKALQAALGWLAAHQARDGSWDADGFSDRCGAVGAGTCDGAGEPLHDVGVTGLALLAFLGDGHTTREGLHSASVTRGVRWIVGEQNPDTGLIGHDVGHAYVYDHAIATLALAEAYTFSGNPLLKRPLELAVRWIEHARNPYGAWRYDVPPTGDSDTSVTGWMVFALTAARDAGIVVDPQAFHGALSWIDEVTDAGSGRVGYDGPGRASARVPHVNDHFPPERGETMTAVGLLCRFFLGQTPEDEPLMERHANVLTAALPERPTEYGTDAYAVYYATYAMYQMGGRHWREWKEALERNVLPAQRHEGDLAGSWDPDGPWGFSGGRVYSTALLAMCLEVTRRYSRLTGTGARAR